MNGIFDRRPEFMILVAVLVAAVIGLIGSVVGCSVMASTASTLQGQLSPYPGNNIGDIDGPIETTPRGDTERGYTADDVPETMVIDVPELQGDLQALINYDMKNAMNLQDKAVKVTELTKDEVGTPELKNGQVLCQVKGKATIENADGETGTVDYTSYYYAEDPTKDKVVWYIYAYDLGSYDLFPSGFKEKSGDPMGIRNYLQSGDSAEAAKTELGREKGRDAQAA
jgi:hypothetical protein